MNALKKGREILSGFGFVCTEIGKMIFRKKIELKIGYGVLTMGFSNAKIPVSFNEEILKKIITDYPHIDIHDFALRFSTPEANAKIGERCRKLLLKTDLVVPEHDNRAKVVNISAVKGFCQNFYEQEALLAAHNEEQKYWDELYVKQFEQYEQEQAKLSKEERKKNWKEKNDKLRAEYKAKQEELKKKKKELELRNKNAPKRTSKQKYEKKEKAISPHEQLVADIQEKVLIAYGNPSEKIAKTIRWKMKNILNLERTSSEDDVEDQFMELSEYLEQHQADDENLVDLEELQTFYMDAVKKIKPAIKKELASVSERFMKIVKFEKITPDLVLETFKEHGFTVSRKATSDIGGLAQEKLDRLHRVIQRDSWKTLKKGKGYTLDASYLTLRFDLGGGYRAVADANSKEVLCVFNHKAYIRWINSGGKHR